MRGTISLIAAIGERNRVIGRNNRLPWSVEHLPADMQRFRKLTAGKPVVMGRSTWDSLPEEFRPLPKRTNIVVTRDQGRTFPGAVAAYSVCAALERAEHFLNDDQEIMVIGGSEIYERALPKARRLYLTLVDEDAPGDRFFPEEYAAFFPQVVERTPVPNSPIPLTFLTLERG